MGIFTQQGPSKTQLEEGSFTQDFIGRGYKNGVAQTPTSPPNREIVASIKGPEMGYVATPIFVIECALQLLSKDNREKIPYGVLTPASAFSNVFDDLVSKLKDHGIEFSVKSKRDL